jgi:hypothetical protein
MPHDRFTVRLSAASPANAMPYIGASFFFRPKKVQTPESRLVKAE